MIGAGMLKMGSEDRFTEVPAHAEIGPGKRFGKRIAQKKREGEAPSRVEFPLCLQCQRPLLFAAPVASLPLPQN